MDNWEAWLNLYAEKQHDEDWLAQSAEQVIEALFFALNICRRELEAIRGIIHLYPYIVKQRKTSDLSQRLQDALLIMQERRDTLAQMHLWARLGHAKQLMGHKNGFSVGIDIAFDHAHNENDRQELIFTLCELLHLLAERQATEVPLALVNRALSLVMQFDSTALQGDLLSALAAAYANSGEKFLAFKYGEKALSIWLNAGQTIRAARVARTMATAARLEPYPDFDNALHFLDVASDLYAISDDRRQYVVMNYEKGAIEFMRDRFKRALELFQLALREYHNLPQEWPVTLGAILHCLGLTYIHLGEYRQGVRYLRQSLRTWRRLQDAFQIAALYNDVGYLLIQLKRLQWGWAWLLGARILCSRLSQSKRQQWLLNRIQDNLRRIADNK